jgi:hypothetical protein
MIYSTPEFIKLTPGKFMPGFILNYTLHDGFIHNWLVAGPLQSELSSQQAQGFQNADKNISEFSTEKGSGVTIAPVDIGNLGEISERHPEIYWRYYACGNDHFINFSRFYAIPKFLECWAYCKLWLPDQAKVQLQLTVKGSAELWLNDQPTRLITKLTPRMQLGEADVELYKGENQILIRYFQVGIGETSSFIAFKLTGIHPDAQVQLPVELDRDQYQKRIDLERVADAAYLDQYVFGYMDGDRYDRNEPISLRFSDDLQENGQLTFRMQGLGGSIFQEMTQFSASSSEFELAKIFPLRSGPHHLAISPIAGDYYQKNVQFQRRDYFYVVRTGYSTKGGKKDKQRIIEALDDAGKRRNESVFCEIAKMALGQWEKIHWEYVRAAVSRVKRSEENSVFDVIGLLGIAGRFWDFKKLPEDLIRDIPEAIIGFTFPEVDARYSGTDFITGGREGLFYACEYLAGQLYPDQTFTKSQLTGRQHQAEAELKITRWIQDSFSYGFREWDSPQAIEVILAALTHLVDLVKDDAIRDMAIVLMDKTYYYLAINTFYGAYGSTHGSSDTASVISTRLSATSGITRLMWGMGNYNDHVIGVVSLGCCKKYRLPAIIRKLAIDPAPVLWDLEKHATSPGSKLALQQGLSEVNKVTYRTRDFMLSSAQDYAPGNPGKREHIWQATLGPDAVVFVNHPFITDEMDIAESNLWVGNQILPRVAQWGDLLIAIHHIPEDDWMGYTHAYFPMTKFDEYAFNGNWAFARKSDGYLALSALNGFELIKTGKTAYRELRSGRANQVWICQMGQVLLDGDFRKFQAKILALDCQYTQGVLALRSIRGDVVRFGWEESFNVNGQDMPLRLEKHIQNSYCIADHPARQIEIIHKKSGIRLGI